MTENHEKPCLSAHCALLFTSSKISCGLESNSHDGLWIPKFMPPPEIRACAFQFWGESAGWPLDLTPGPSPDDETAVVRRGVHVSPPLPKSAFRLRERGSGGEAKPAPKLKCIHVEANQKPTSHCEDQACDNSITTCVPPPSRSDTPSVPP